MSMTFFTFINVYYKKYKVYKQLSKLMKKLTKIHELRDTSGHPNFLYFFFFFYRIFVKLASCTISHLSLRKYFIVKTILLSDDKKQPPCQWLCWTPMVELRSDTFNESNRRVKSLGFYLVCSLSFFQLSPLGFTISLEFCSLSPMHLWELPLS